MTNSVASADSTDTPFETMPEDLPAADSIKKLERAEKKRLTAPKKPKQDDESR